MAAIESEACTDFTSATITVLFSTHNRARSLSRTLESLAAQQANKIDWRVVVVNNACTDDTDKVLAQYRADVRLRVDVLHEPRRGKSRALNRALDHIDDGLILFTDDDVSLKPDWLRVHADAVKRWPNHAIFGGPIIPVFPEGAPSWIQDERYVNQATMFARYAPRADEGTTNMAPFGPNMAIRRAAIGAHRFDEQLGPGGDRNCMGQESELELRLAGSGEAPFVYIPDAVVEHHVRPEQMTVAAVLQRACRSERSKVLIFGRTGRGPFLLGVPSRYWLAAIRSFIRFMPFRFGPHPFQLEYGWQWHSRLGRIRGYMDTKRGRAARS